MGHGQGVVSLRGEGGQIGKRSKGFGASRPGFWSLHISSLGRVTERQSLPSVSLFVKYSLLYFILILQMLQRGVERQWSLGLPGPSPGLFPLYLAIVLADI